MTIDEIMRLARVIPVLVLEGEGDWKALAETLVGAGLPVLEVTLRTPVAMRAIGDIAQVPGAIVGAGTVLNPAQLEAAMGSGARFIVSPGLTEPLAHAAIDVSDGLAADLGHIAETSGVAAVVEASSVPLSTAAAAALELESDLRDAVLGGGDDYELLFTVPPGAAASVAALASDLGLPLTAIGRIESGHGVRLTGAGGAEIGLPSRGYTHR